MNIRIYIGMIFWSVSLTSSVIDAMHQTEKIDINEHTIFFGPLVERKNFDSTIAKRERKKIITNHVLKRYVHKALYVPLFHKQRDAEEAQHDSSSFLHIPLIRDLLNFFQLESPEYISYPHYNEFLIQSELRHHYFVQQLQSMNFSKQYASVQNCLSYSIPYYKRRYYYAAIMSAEIDIQSTMHVSEKSIVEEAIRNDDYMFLLFLLQRGALPVKERWNSWTMPLLAQARRKPIAQLLLAFGANLYQRRYADSATLLHEKVRAIGWRRYNQFPYTAIEWEDFLDEDDIILKRTKKLLKYFISCGIPVAAVDEHNQTILHCFASFSYFREEDLSLLDVLLKNGVPLDTLNMSKYTAADILVMKRLRGKSALKRLIAEKRNRKNKKLNNWKRFIKAWMIARDNEDNVAERQGLPCYIPVEIVEKIRSYVLRSPDILSKYYFEKT